MKKLSVLLLTMVSCLGIVSFIVGSNQPAFPREQDGQQSIYSGGDLRSPSVLPTDEHSDHSDRGLNSPMGGAAGARRVSHASIVNALNEQERAVLQAEQFFNERAAQYEGCITHLQRQVRQEQDSVGRWQAACCGTGCVCGVAFGILALLGHIS